MAAVRAPSEKQRRALVDDMRIAITSIYLGDARQRRLVKAELAALVGHLSATTWQAIVAVECTRKKTKDIDANTPNVKFARSVHARLFGTKDKPGFAAARGQEALLGDVRRAVLDSLARDFDDARDDGPAGYALAMRAIIADLRASVTHDVVERSPR